MKIRFLSDTHFDDGINGTEFHNRHRPMRSAFGKYFGKALKGESADVTLIAGDLASNLENTKQFLEEFFPNELVYFVSGNHSVYNYDGLTIYENKKALYDAFPKEHLFWHYLENDWVFLPGSNNELAVIGSEFYTDYKYHTYTVDSYNERMQKLKSSLFTCGYGDDTPYTPVTELNLKNIKAHNMIEAKNGLNDFRWGYETKTRNITPATYLKLHKKAKKEVLRCYSEIMAINPKAKVILMTHHCLSPKCIASEYATSVINSSYVSDLESWLSKNMPNLRIVHSGHVHSGKDFTFGKDNKRYIVNPCGYVKYREPFQKNNKFNVNFIVESKDI